MLELFVEYVQPFLPDAIVRVILRAVLRYAVWSLRRLRWPRRELRLVERITALAETDIAFDTDAANQQHYEVPTDFFLMSLGPCLKYSSCEWPSLAASLADAEAFTLEKHAEMLGLAPGQRVLDIGCGWGSFSLYAAEHFPDVSFVCFSNSNTQIGHITAMAAERGLRNLVAFKLDINRLSASELKERGVLTRPFDRVFACESLEHSRNYHTLFQRVAEVLDPAGLMLVQVLGHREYSYLMDTNSWMGRRFFTGGTIPSMHFFHFFNKHLIVERTEVVEGTQYKRTLDAWLALMYAKRAACVRALAAGEPLAVGRRRFQEWRMFYLFCSESFGLRDGREWMIGYFTFRKR